MTVRTPPGVINTESTDSSVQRDVHRSLLGGSLSAFAGGVGAVNGAAHGVCGADHLVVSQSGTPGMSVDVAAGSAFVTGTASALQGPYNFVNDASVTLPIAAADATNPRYDLVIAQIRDDTYDGSGVRDARLTVVTGTPAASPSDPSLASYPNALVLSRVEVPASASSILDANITDLRTFGGWQRLTGGLWVPFTPAWGAGLTVGNGVEAASYCYMPGGLAVRGVLTFGSTTAISGSVQQTIPDSAAVVSGSPSRLGDWTTSGTGFAAGMIRVASSTVVTFQVFNASGTYLTLGNISAAVPFAWSNGDTLAWTYFAPIS